MIDFVRENMRHIPGHRVDEWGDSVGGQHLYLCIYSICKTGLLTSLLTTSLHLSENGYLGPELIFFFIVSSLITNKK